MTQAVHDTQSAKRALRAVGHVLAAGTPGEVTQKGATFVFLMGLQMGAQHEAWAKAVLQWLGGPGPASTDLIVQILERFPLDLSDTQ